MVFPLYASYKALRLPVPSIAYNENSTSFHIYYLINDLWFFPTDDQHTTRPITVA